MEIKKMIQKLIRRGDESCTPIDFNAYQPSNLLRYLLALQTSEGKRFVLSTYNSIQSALHYVGDMVDQSLISFWHLARC